MSPTCGIWPYQNCFISKRGNSSQLREQFEMVGFLYLLEIQKVMLLDTVRLKTDSLTPANYVNSAKQKQVKTNL